MTAIAWQKAEGAGIALGGLVIAAMVPAELGWLGWVIALLAPDLGMAGYLAGPRIGAASYNLAHLYALPFLLMIAGVGLGLPVLIAVGGLWLAHIGIDRALGLGLKAATGFGDTHLGRIGHDGGA
ncbi:DUF4260 domain-containing protein [Paracoccus sp. DMF-8]|uniref:DUF4260 domain-containing protein n=1 Tax=Paracoccus sp. DMF-8 TaxID=3019445 RepID=UPI0023E4303C|nr:DUF4260 domain-containing protein [Paracoccus sp. DMF-8]MDF3607351.1 DUF4260 domain-containing protein [Paracoccus sp. DMF-8]